MALQEFFAGEASLYDDTIELVAPLYKRAHQALMQVLSYHWEGGRLLWPTGDAGIYAPTLGDAPGPQGWVLDIGSGTGFESISLLRRYPRLKVVALDLCPAMHDALAANYEAATKRFPELANRIIKVTGEIEGFIGEPDRLLMPDKSVDIPEGYLAVISAFTLHHVHRKLDVYRLIHQILGPRGLFANADLFTFSAPTIKNWAHNHDLDWIDRQFGDPEPEFERSRQVPAADRDEHRKRWHDHYRFQNNLKAIESKSDAVANGTGEGEAANLLTAGFTEVACPFRYWQMGVMVALKN